MHIHSDFLTVKPVEGKVRSLGGKCSLVENARIVCDNVCSSFDGVFPLTDFGSCQYEVVRCEAEF
jgi:hypothetical protein